MGHPPDKLYDVLGLVLRSVTVTLFTVHEDPGEAAHRVPVWSIRIGEADHHVVGQGDIGGFARRCDGGFDPVAFLVLDVGIGHLVLKCVNQFDVTKTPWCLLYEPGNSRVTFASQAGRPV